ncbi:hypothetical protein J7438_24905 [Thalassotalea sp. G20_0]|uniref:hypothetical protein n=1 Tax=Thalassotalea sp. G20_0 TaxID=2821093 RepID=UPI001ADC68B1|nr:hypothetical protein [Thalassotalea sp. G20_0]MBO9497298.1 hypothetical protein [Thalassotalea sp. G20_0]
MAKHLHDLERILKDLSDYEKKGLDTSYLKSFIKQYKVFIDINDLGSDISSYSYEDKLEIIREIMSDRSIFPNIKDIIFFANEEMDIEFKSQNASRDTTISRIIKRVEKDPEVKRKLKRSLLWAIEDAGYALKTKSHSSRKASNSIELSKWVEILKDL